MYPFYPGDLTYLSKFELGFRGCFKCGSLDHNRRDKCPVGYTATKEMLDVFYEDLHIHKPYLDRNCLNNQVSN